MATAVLTRSNNATVNDSFRSETLFSSREGADALETVDMGVADDAIGLVLDMLSDISADRGAYALREAYSNAYDAVRATGDMSRAIRIDIPADGAVDGGLTRKLYDDRMNRVVDVTVSDEGTGMSPDDVRRFFLQYGGSKKRGDADTIGSKGLGSKAPLAVSDAFRVRTTKDGVTTTATIERRPDGNKATLSVAETGEQSGTEVTIPVSDPAVLEQMNGFAAKLSEGNLDATLYINGEHSTSVYPTEVGSAGNGYVYIGEITVPTDDGPVALRAWESENAFPFVPDLDRDAIDLNLCGVMYHLHAPESRGYYYSVKPQGTVIVAGEPGFLNFTPSRDEVRKDAAREGFVTAIAKAIKAMDFSEATGSFITGGGISRILGVVSGNGGTDCANINGTSYSGPSPVMEGVGSSRRPASPLTFRWSGRQPGYPDFTVPASRLRFDGTDVSPLFSRAAHDGCGIRARAISVSPAGMNVTTSCLRVPERARSDRPNQGTFCQVSRSALAKGTDSKASLGDGILLRDAVAACAAFRPSDATAANDMSRIAALTVILGVGDGAAAGSMLRAESHFRTPVDAGKLSGTVLYLMVDAASEAELPAWCRTWMGWMHARTLTLGEFLDEASANRKAKQAASRKMREAEAKAKKGSEALRKSLETTTLRVVANADVLSTGEVLRADVSTKSSYGIANVMDGGCVIGVIAGNFSTDALNRLTIMATAILGRAGRQVRVVIMPRPTKATMDALVDAGAVIIADERANVKRRYEDTLVDRVRRSGGSVEFRTGEGYTEAEKRENRCGAIGIPASMLGPIDGSAISLAVIHELDKDGNGRGGTALSKALTAYAVADMDVLGDAGRKAISNLEDLCGGRASKSGIPPVKSVTRDGKQVEVRVPGVAQGSKVMAYPVLDGADAEKAQAVSASIRALAEVGGMFNGFGIQVSSQFVTSYYGDGSIDLANYDTLRSVIGKGVAEAIDAAAAQGAK